MFGQVRNDCNAVLKPSWFPYYVPWNYFLENQKVILQIFWENKCTVNSGIGVYGPGFGHIHLPLFEVIFYYDNAFPHRPL